MKLFSGPRKPNLDDIVRTKVTKHGLPAGSTGKVLAMDWNAFGQGSHRYWVAINGNSRDYTQKEITL